MAKTGTQKAVGASIGTLSQPIAAAVTTQKERDEGAKKRWKKTDEKEEKNTDLKLQS